MITVVVILLNELFFIYLVNSINHNHLFTLTFMTSKQIHSISNLRSSVFIISGIPSQTLLGSG